MVALSSPYLSICDALEVSNASNAHDSPDHEGTLAEESRDEGAADKAMDGEGEGRQDQGVYFPSGMDDYPIFASRSPENPSTS